VKLAYLVPNAAWVCLFGDSLVRMEGEPLFFTLQMDANEALQRHGLKLGRKLGGCLFEIEVQS
jgi:hypothetical protein